MEYRPVNPRIVAESAFNMAKVLHEYSKLPPGEKDAGLAAQASRLLPELLSMSNHIDPALSLPIDKLGLSKHVYNAIMHHNSSHVLYPGYGTPPLETLGDIISAGRGKIKRISGIGEKGVEELEEIARRYKHELPD